MTNCNCRLYEVTIYYDSLSHIISWCICLQIKLEERAEDVRSEWVLLEEKQSEKRCQLGSKNAQHHCAWNDSSKIIVFKILNLGT